VQPGRALGGLPVGVDEGAAYEAEELTLTPGDRLVLYTDGVTEQRSPRGALFGAEALRRVLSAATSAAEDAAGVFDAVIAHASRDALDDDATVASVGYEGE
jgi:serine phosphatase RsbU (regulator of sigma subunit)